MTDYKKDGIKAEITKSLEARGMNTPIYKNMAAQYLVYCSILDNLNAKADELEGNEDKIKTYLAYIGESRRVLRSMRDLLDWLGVSDDLKRPENTDL